MKNLIFLLMFISFNLTSCTVDTLSPKDFVYWVDNEDNNLIKKQRISNLEYKLQYRPIDYIIAREFRTNTITFENYKKRKNELEGMDYFKFTLTSLEPNKTVFDMNTLEKNVLDYVSFEMAKDFKMKIDNELISCGLYHFEQQNGIYNSIDILLGFPKTKNKSEEFSISFENNLNNEGIINFYFSSNELNRIPNMKKAK